MNPSPAQTQRATIFIVDDHPLLRHALRSVISRELDFEVCGEAGDTATALDALADCRPDVMTVDLSLKDSSGLDLVKDLRALHPHVRTLVLTMDGSVDTALRAMRAGAGGFMSKQDSMRNLVPALRRVLAGQRYLTPPLDEMLLDQLLHADTGTGSPWELLSDRECETMRLLATGCETEAIAATLRTSPSTVRTYYERIKQKLGLHTERELIVAAVRLTLSSPRRQ